MNSVRIGLLGLGNMGRFHADYLSQKGVNHCELTAIATSNPEKAAKYPGVRLFDAPEALIDSGSVDAVVIATPHYSHTTLGIRAFERELHVMVEKPISAHVADCERLIAAHRKSKRVFAAMFQLRTEPRYQKLKRLITTGELGEIVRINWIITDWFRTEAYYASGGWRATWKGEGGGALLNQCPHHLDLLHWLFGRPARVRGFCQFGRYHNIEVEDNVTVYLEYPNQATGLFGSSTGEAPGTNRFEIAGERGKVVIENGRMTFTRNEIPMTEFSRVAKNRLSFARSFGISRDFPRKTRLTQHATVMQNFVDAINDGRPLIAPGEDGLYSVEVANAALYSSWTGQMVKLPLDGAAYEEKLSEKIANSHYEKHVSPISAEDLTKSFTR